VNGANLLVALQRMGLRIEVQAQALRVSPKAHITPGMRRLIQRHRVHLLLAAAQAKEFQFAPPTPTAGIEQAQCAATWAKDRERAARAFWRNVKCVMNAASNHRDGLLLLYEREAGRRYGAEVARYMVSTLRQACCRAPTSELETSRTADP
jgi:hypothetical protein